MLHVPHPRPFPRNAQHALLHYVFGLSAVADHEIGGTQQAVGMGRDEALELGTGPGSFQQADGRRRVCLGLLIFPLNPCGATKGSIEELAAAAALAR